MAKRLVVDVATGVSTLVDLTAAEQQQTDADAATAAVMEQRRQASAVRAADAEDALGQLIAIAGGRNAVRAKAKSMAAGTDGSSLDVVRRIVGVLMLDALRDREDS